LTEVQTHCTALTDRCASGQETQTRHNWTQVNRHNVRRQLHTRHKQSLVNKCTAFVDKYTQNWL